MKMKHARVAVVAALFAGGLSGCAVFLLGAGAAGGYAISKDSITNHYDLSSTVVYQAAREVIGDEGLVTLEDEHRGLIKAEVLDANVTIQVRKVSDRTTQLQVKARNDLLLPKIAIAQNVYNKIDRRLAD